MKLVPSQHPAPPRDGWPKGSPPPPILPCLAPTQPSSQPGGVAGPRAQSPCSVHPPQALQRGCCGAQGGTGRCGARSCGAGRGGAAACAALHAPKLNGIIHLLWLQHGVCWQSCQACPGPAAMAGTDRRGGTRRCSLGLGTLRGCPQVSRWGSVGMWGCPPGQPGQRDRGTHPVCQQLAPTRGREVAPATQCLHFGIPTNDTKLLAPASSWPGGEGLERDQDRAEPHWHLTLL